MNRKGFLDLITLIVIAFGSVIMFGVFIFAFGEIRDALMTAPSTAAVNISNAAAQTFGRVDLTGLRTVSFIIIFGMIMTIFITNYFIKAHPVFFIPYTFAVILAVIISAYISNAYETILRDPLMLSILVDFKGTNYILLHLPIWITVIGLIGGLLLFANILKDREGGGNSIF